MIINHNIPAMNTNRQLAINNNATSASLEKLSSGFRINRAGDDAAGLAISEKMRGQIRGLDMAARNAQDDISLLQTAEGAMGSIENILQRMRELAVQSSNGTNTSSDRGQIQKEVNHLVSEITRIADTTEFNTQKLLNGTFSTKASGGNAALSGSLPFHIGANYSQRIDVNIPTMNAGVLGVSGSKGAGASIDPNGDLGVTSYQASMSGASPIHGVASATGSISLSTAANANKAIAAIDVAISMVSSARADLGAIQNRLEYSIANLNVASENTSAAEARIRDVDMSKEMMNFTKNNILTQAATAMLAQANQQPQTVLTLLR